MNRTTIKARVPKYSVAEIDELRKAIWKLHLAKVNGCDCAEYPAWKVWKEARYPGDGHYPRCPHGLATDDPFIIPNGESVDAELRVYMTNGTKAADILAEIPRAALKSREEKKRLDDEYEKALKDMAAVIAADAEAARLAEAEAEAFRVKVIEALRGITVRDVAANGTIIVAPGEPDPTTKHGFLAWLGLR